MSIEVEAIIILIGVLFWNIIGTDTYFLEVKIVKRIFLLERMNSRYGVPDQ